MSLSEDRKKIFETLKKYGRRYNADYYCILLTPVEDSKGEVGLYGSKRIALTYKGIVGAVIEGVVERERCSLSHHRRENSQPKTLKPWLPDTEKDTDPGILEEEDARKI